MDRDPERLTLKERIIQEVLAAARMTADPDDETYRRMIAQACVRSTEGQRMTLAGRRTLAAEVFHAMRGLDVLQPLLEDPGITEIMVVGPDRIYVEREGRIAGTNLRFDSQGRLEEVIRTFFARGDRSISETAPIADLRLPDGSRAHAVLPPVAPEGPLLTIRKFTGIRPSLDVLAGAGTLSPETAGFLRDAVRRRRTLFISGGTGSGKTTFLNALAAEIAPEERIVTVEDSAELRFEGHPHHVRLEARQPGPDGAGGIGLDLLIRASLRMRPDRLIVGEVRGPEAYDMLQALNTGHPGSLCTGHANSPGDMVERIITLCMAASRLQYAVVQRMVASALDLVVHLRRDPDGRRRVDQVVRIVLGQDGHIRLEPACEAGTGACASLQEAGA